MGLLKKIKSKRTLYLRGKKSENASVAATNSTENSSLAATNSTENSSVAAANSNSTNACTETESVPTCEYRRVTSIRVTSIPKEQSLDTIGSFNWLTRSMEDIQWLGSASRSTSTSNSTNTSGSTSTSRSATDDTLPSQTQDDEADKRNSPWTGQDGQAIVLLTTSSATTCQTQDDEADKSNNAPTPADDEYETRWGWLSSLSSCWPSPPLLNKMDDPTYQSSYDDDDGSGESSQPSLSRIDQELKVPVVMADEISDVTSVPSMYDSDSDSENLSYSGDCTVEISIKSEKNE